MMRRLTILPSLILPFLLFSSIIFSTHASAEETEKIQVQMANMDTPEVPGPKQEQGDNDQKFSIHVTQEMQIDVMNGLPPNGPNITVSCKSADNDIGTHSIAPNHYILWKFHPAVFRLTLFWCNWNLGPKHLSTEVYNQKQDHHLCIVPEPNWSNVCHWQAREDGIYFTAALNQPKSSPKWVKKYSW